MYALFCKVGKEVQLLDFDDYPLNIQQPLWPKNALNGLKWWKPTKKVTESGKIVLNQPKLGQEMTELAKKWKKSTETLLNQLKFSMYRLKLSLYPKKKNTANSAEKQRKQAERWLNRPKFDVHPPKILNRPRLGWHEFGQPHKHLYPDQGYPYPEQWITYTDNQTRHRSILFQIKLS